jgi:hypothetical protein
VLRVTFATHCVDVGHRPQGGVRDEQALHVSERETADGVGVGPVIGTLPGCY